MARLTDRSIEALRPKATRYEVWDEARKGFGLRVTPRGVKSFVWVYHFENRPRRLTFGTYPRLSLSGAGDGLAITVIVRPLSCPPPQHFHVP